LYLQVEQYNSTTKKFNKASEFETNIDIIIDQRRTHVPTDQTDSVMSEFGDFIQPFQIEDLGLLGRVVRLDGVLASAFARQSYPVEVASLLAESMVLTAGLSGIIKFEGIFTLQTQSDGPVNLLMSDITSDGDMRGYARFDESAVELASDQSGSIVPKILGAGHLALTVDQGQDMERYQGIVELTGNSISDCAQEYFKNSEQLETASIIFSEIEVDKIPRAAALLIQRMPSEVDEAIDGSDDDEAWNRAVALMSSIKAEELLSTELSVSQVLYRLYHEDGVRVYKQKSVQHTCRCSYEKVSSTLASFPREEIEDMSENGLVTVTCEFCKTDYRFSKEDIESLFE
jgi:molecular chaperone Hsp33